MVRFVLLFAVGAMVTLLLTYFVQRNKMNKQILYAVFIGFIIALTGLLIQDIFHTIQVILLLFSLAFAMSILLDKRFKRSK